MAQDRNSAWLPRPSLVESLDGLGAFSYIAIMNGVRTSRRFNVMSAVAALILWGGWAWWTNGTSSIVSALAQGTFSFCMTLGMVAIVTRLFHYFKNPLARSVLPGILMVSLSASILTAVHWWVQTPHIFQTIAPALTVAFGFCLLTCQKLERAKHGLGGRASTS